MNIVVSNTAAVDDANAGRVAELFGEQQQNIIRHTDRLMAWLMICQWLFAVGLAVWISPRTWSGMDSQIHPHVWLAIILGGLITGVPVILALAQPGKTMTRHTVAIGQMLMSALLVHLTGGRIETHFHIFGSLAILAFYRDWRVLISASVVVYLDHLVRGMFWPESVYGVMTSTYWRSLEHLGWVLFEVICLLIAMRKSQSEMLLVAERQARLEALKAGVEQTVAARTADLTREIEERRHTEVKLLKIQAQLAQAQQIAKIGSWEWDLIRDEVVFSEQTRRIYGYTAGGVFGMEQCLERVHPEDRGLVRQTMTDAIKKGTPYCSQHRTLLPDGTVHFVQGQGQLLKDDAGKPVKLFGIVQDVTEAQRSKEALRFSDEQLRQAQKMEAIGTLTGGIAHDFNNILGSVFGYGYLLQQDVKGNAAAEEDLAEMLKAAARAKELVQQLLTFSRQREQKPEVFRLDAIVRDVAEFLRASLPAEIKVETNLATDSPAILAEPAQIRQVMMNLATNALHAMEGRAGQIKISLDAFRPDEAFTQAHSQIQPVPYLRLIVSDNGTGMDEKTLARIFDPFFTTKPTGKGTGLGLAVVHGIVQAQEGAITVESELGRGTTITVYLPAKTETVALVPALPVASPSQPVIGGGRDILFLDDEPALTATFKRLLERLKYQVTTSNSAREALELIRKEPARFDLVITDFKMPEMNGLELARQLHLIRGSLPVILISGLTTDLNPEKLAAANICERLDKPVSMTLLTAAVQRNLDKARAGADAGADQSRLESKNSETESNAKNTEHATAMISKSWLKPQASAASPLAG
jgi:PAS domain S-box-containing protein